MFCFCDPFFSTLSCSQLLGDGAVTLMHLGGSHPRGDMDLGLVRHWIPPAMRPSSLRFLSKSLLRAESF